MAAWSLGSSDVSNALWKDPPVSTRCDGICCLPQIFHFISFNFIANVEDSARE